MKRCPKCQQTFSDDTSFCLMDGTPLAFLIDQPEQATVVRSSPIGPQQAASARKSLAPILGCSALALLGLMVFGGAGLWFAFVRNPSPPAKNVVNAPSVSNVSNKDQELIDQQRANLQDQQAEIEREKQKLANERRTIDDQKKTPPITVPTTAPPPASDPPTARINFHRGSVQETVSGGIVARRSFVLRTMAGQYLYSRVASGGSCVVFSNGYATMTHTTIQGDSSLTLVNNCGRPANFSLTVFIR